MKWLDTTSANAASSASAAFWSRHQEELQTGQFWADRIKKYHNFPIDRLRLAIDNLPLPAAFREAAIAIRALVRLRQRASADVIDELVLLYWLAGVESFGVPYSEYLQQPGFNVLQSIPGDVVKTLPFTYADLGYKELTLLNKTDVKWLVQTRGEPRTHTTLNKLHRAVWHEYEVAEKARQERQRVELWR